MYKAVIRCTKAPIICTNQCGRSYNYCNGSIECQSQRAVIEYMEDAQQDNTNSNQTNFREPPKQVSLYKKYVK